MKILVTFLITVCCSFSFAVVNERPNSSNPELEVLEAVALSHMSSCIDSADIGEEVSGEAVEVQAPGLSQLGSDSLEEVLEQSLEIRNSSEMVDFIDDVNSYYGVFGPIFMARCCACGDCGT